MLIRQVSGQSDLTLDPLQEPQMKADLRSSNLENERVEKG